MDWISLIASFVMFFICLQSYLVSQNAYDNGVKAYGYATTIMIFIAAVGFLILGVVDIL